MTYGDYNGNGHFDMGDVDRWQLDNGGYPGQYENAESGDFCTFSYDIYI